MLKRLGHGNFLTLATPDEQLPEPVKVGDWALVSRQQQENRCIENGRTTSWLEVEVEKLWVGYVALTPHEAEWQPIVRRDAHGRAVSLAERTRTYLLKHVSFIGQVETPAINGYGLTAPVCPTRHADLILSPESQSFMIMPIPNETADLQPLIPAQVIARG